MEDWTTQLQADLAKLTETITIAPAKTSALLPGERRDVAILFLDIKGFTSLSETMDHEMVHKVIGGVMGALSRVVEGFGGYVDKFEGDLIMALFGAKVASEHDCQRAISCALQMLETLKDIRRILSAKGIDLGARIGINYGAVTVGPDPSGHLTAMGDEVNLASRMESTAEVNTILITENAYRICMKWYRWIDLGFVPVKGKQEPVHVYRPIAATPSQSENEDNVFAFSRIPMIGRAAVLQELTDWVFENRDDFQKHRILIVQGDAGIGKTRLLQEFSKRLPVDECRLISTATRSFAQPPFWIWQEFFRKLFFTDNQKQTFEQAWNAIIETVCHSENNDGVLRRIQNAKPYISSLLGYHDESVSKEEQSVRHQNTILAIRDVYRFVAVSTTRLLFAIDDWQWVDQASLETLQFLLEQTPTQKSLRMMILTRSDDDSNNALFQSADANSKCFIHRIALTPLTETDTVTLAQIVWNESAAIDPVRLPKRVSQSIATKSQGNPYFITELCHQIRSSNTIEQTLDAIPSTLSALLRAKIDRMPDQERSSLQFCSVLGTEFSQQLFLAAARKLKLAFEYDSPFERFIALGFLSKQSISNDMNYRFTQILLHNAAYETCLLHNRAIIHRCAAKELEAMQSRGEEDFTLLIAHHWNRAGDSEKTIQWGLQCLTKLCDQYQFDDACYWSSRIIELLQNSVRTKQTDDAHYRALSPIIALLWLQGKIEEYKTAIETMRQIAERRQWNDRKAAVLCSFGTYYERIGKRDEAISQYREAIALASETKTIAIEIRAINDLGTIYLAQQEYEKAEEYFQSALPLERTHQVYSSLGTTLTNLGVIHRNRGQYSESKACNLEALAVAKQIKHRKLEATILLNLANVEYCLDQVETSYQLFQQALALLREIGNRLEEAITLSNLGYLRFEQNRYAEAETLYRESLDLTREIRSPLNEANVSTNLGMLYRQVGKLDQATVMYREVTCLIETNRFLKSAFSDYMALREELIEEGITSEQLQLPLNWQENSSGE